MRKTILAATFLTAIAIALIATRASTPSRNLKAMDLNGIVRPLPTDGQKAAVLVFLGVDCPISNQATPTLNDLATQYAGKVDFFGVISDPHVSRASALEHAKSFDVKFPILFDTSGILARELKPTVTPEAFVITQDGIAYRGRIDDSFAALGKKRAVVTSHDLADAVDQVLADKPVGHPKTDPIGCDFESWDNPAVPAKITWSRDVAPIVYANCVSCHHDGEVAPFSLMTFEDAVKRKSMLADVTADGYMPPWKPVDCSVHFLGTRGLSDSEKAILCAWAKTGGAQGDPADAPGPPTFAGGWMLGQPDVIVQMPVEMEIPASGKDIYRAFAAKIPIDQDHLVSAVEFKPGNPKVVHHCLLFLDGNGAAMAKQKASTIPGFASFGGLGFLPSGGLGGWAPGATPRFLPDGTGRPLKAGWDLVFQMHYHPSGKIEHDRSQVGIYFVKGETKGIIGSIPMGVRDIDIPAGEKNYTREKSVTLPAEVKLVGLTPHMHLIGKTMTLTASEPDGTKLTLINIHDWDFKWQDQYFFDRPIILPKATKLYLTATYDNSAENPNNPSSPPQRVKHGEQTTDEMCFCFLQVEATTQKDLQRQRRAVMWGF